MPLTGMTPHSFSPRLHEPLFSPHNHLNEDAISPTIPDQPFVDSSRDSVEEFLQTELETCILDELFRYLCWVAPQISHRVDALHIQNIKGRRVVITENPKLHLIWHANVIYIKPIPQCLLNYDFWKEYLCGRAGQSSQEASRHLPAALGFLRTYALLIRHPTDLRLAVESHLLPDHVDWNRFARFIQGFRHVTDDYVSPRYHFGQLRLTRLNWAVRLLRPTSSSQWWYYHEMYWHTGAYMERFFAPLLFVFGSLAIVLTAMQVLVAGPEESFMTASQWTAMAKTSWGFSIAAIALIALIWLAFVGGTVVLLVSQMVFAARTKRRGRLSRRASRGVKGEEAGMPASNGI